MILLILATLIGSAAADIIDYTRQDYILIENGDVSIYEQYGNIFHITNLTYFENIIEQEKQSFYNTVHYEKTNNELNILNLDTESEILVIETLLRQLKQKPIRQKRGINELGTLWKWIAGTPDHDDFVKINDKLDELVTSNNKQFTTNSQIFKIITELSNTVQSIKGDTISKTIKKKRNQYIIHELQNMINTITFGKIGILNPTILHLDELKNITNYQHGTMTITDLMDISEFKLVQKNDIIILYIKYPQIKLTCKYYETRAIAQIDGKLLIDKHIIQCDNEFFNVQNCKTEILNTYCKINYTRTCLSEILNKRQAKCNKIKERNLQLEIIKQGAILISGENIVENKNLSGTYLITYENQTIINNVTYVNMNAKIWNYLRHEYVNDFEILEYIETTNKELKLENINLLGKEDIIIKTHLSILYIVILLCIILALYIFLKFKKTNTSAKSNKNIETQENTYKNILNQIQELTENNEESRTIHLREGGVNGRPHTPLQC